MNAGAREMKTLPLSLLPHLASSLGSLVPSPDIETACLPPAAAACPCWRRNALKVRNSWAAEHRATVTRRRAGMVRLLQPTGSKPGTFQQPGLSQYHA